MIKKILILMMVLGFVLSSHATTWIDWGAAFGFNDISGVTDNIGLLGDATGNKTIVQLIYSVDSVADYVDPGAAGYVSGDDSVLQQFVLTENGVSGDYDDFAFFTSTYSNASFSAGYFYGRIFQDDTVALGEKYYDGAVIALVNYDALVVPPMTQQTYEMGNVFTGDGTELNKVVPEPSTFAMVAFGVAAISGRVLRKRKKKS